MKKIAIVVLALSTGGCAQDMSLPKMSMPGLIGASAGAAIGGWAGYQFGGGLGQLAYTTVGAIVGGAGGYIAGEQLLPSDLALYQNTAQKGLSESPDGQTLSWHNPETGNQGVFRPVRSFVAMNGRSCRHYRTTVAFTDGFASGDGTAYQAADGPWQIVSNDFG